MLQQLAWLGEDGTIHSVNQPQMTQPLLGASAPMMGAWLDEEGEMHTINDLQNLRLGAWLEEDGEVHTVNDGLQNLNIGAWLGEDGEIHTVNDEDLQNLWWNPFKTKLPKIDLSKEQVFQIVQGVLFGALDTADLDDYITCIQDSEEVVEDIEDAVKNFKRENVRGVTKGFSNLASALTTVSSAIGKCSQQKDIDQVKKLEEMLLTFKNPKSFAFHIGKDLLYNGKSIYKEISDAINQYEAGNLQAFGEDIGNILALIVVGDQEKQAKKKMVNLQVLLI